MNDGTTAINWQEWSPESEPYESITLDRAEGLVRLTFNNPRTLNSLTRRAFAEIPRATRAASDDPDVRAIILTGAGKAFSSGADVRDFLGARIAETERSNGLPDRAGREWPMLGEVEVPVIAAVNGAAAGAGFVLALLADFRIASTEAFFVESHVERGLTPSISACLLPQVVGLGRAAEMVLLGRRITAQAALEAGLVTGVVAPEDLDSAAVELGREIAALPPFAIRTAKGAMRMGLERTLNDVRGWAGTMEALSHATTDELSRGVLGFGRNDPTAAELGGG